MTFEEFWAQSGWARPGEDPEEYGCSEYALAKSAWAAATKAAEGRWATAERSKCIQEIVEYRNNRPTTLGGRLIINEILLVLGSEHGLVEFDLNDQVHPITPEETK